MTKGISLHVGINVILPTLAGCVHDARSMLYIAESRGFKSELLTDKDATLGVVTTKIQKAATELNSGDIFLFTFAGHGSYLGDEDGDEPDSRDETLVLYDYMLSDDVLGRDLWPCFKPGVRVLMVADSCYSGTVSQLAGADGTAHTAESLEYVSTSHRLSRRNESVGTFKKLIAPRGPVLRTISEEARLQHIAANRGFYEKLLNSPPTCGDDSIKASVLLLAACKDDERTGDGNRHGVFTQALLDVWNGGGFVGDYDDFIREIGKNLKVQGLTQTPVITPAGANPIFRGQTPFSI